MTATIVDGGAAGAGAGGSIDGMAGALSPPEAGAGSGAGGFMKGLSDDMVESGNHTPIKPKIQETNQSASPFVRCNLFQQLTHLSGHVGLSMVNNHLQNGS